MITILKNEDQLLLKYTAEGFNDPKWVDSRLKKRGKVTLRKCFTFGPRDLVSESDSDDLSDEYRTFVLGVTEDGYYKIDKRILGLNDDLLLWKQMGIKSKTFIASGDISIFRRIDKLIDEQIVIGGDKDGSIPLGRFDQLIRKFPTSTELTHYANARVTRVLKD